VLAFATAAAALSPRSPPPASREPEVLAVARHRRALQSGNSPLPLGGRPGGAVDSARGATPKSDSQLSYRNPPQNHDCENVDMPAAVTPIVHVTDTACVGHVVHIIGYEMYVCMYTVESFLRMSKGLIFIGVSVHVARAAETPQPATRLQKLLNQSTSNGTRRRAAASCAPRRGGGPRRRLGAPWDLPQAGPNGGRGGPTRQP
jgi:hypothetical protein